MVAVGTRFHYRGSGALLALALVAGCGPSDDVQDPADAAAEAGAALAQAVPGETKAQTAARIRARIDGSLAPILNDPESARYSDTRIGTAGSVCGIVDSKQPDGSFTGPRPFVITPQGIAVVSTAPRVVFEDPTDEFADFYIRWCASPDELRGIAPRIAAAPPAMPLVEEPGAEVSATTEAVPAPAAAPVKPPPTPYSRYPVGQPPVASSAPQAAPPPRPPASDSGRRESDSFFDAVIRPGEEPREGN